MVTCLSLLAVGEYVAPLTGIDAAWLRAIAVFVLAGLLVVLIAARSGREVRIGRLVLRLPDSQTCSRQFLVTALDLAASATVLYVLLPAGTVGWPAFLAIYAVAVGLGVLSHVPAGLGVFEAVIVASLGRAAGVDAVLGALVLYRVIYHLLPLLIAIVVRSASNSASWRATRQPPASPRRRPDDAAIACHAGARPRPDAGSLGRDADAGREPGLSCELRAPTDHRRRAFPCEPFGSGAVHRRAGAGAAPRWRLVGIGRDRVGRNPAFVGEGGGARGSRHARLPSCRASRKSAVFNRPASLFGQALTLPWLTALGVICFGAFVVLLFVYRDVAYSHELWWQFEFSAEAPRGLRAFLGVTIGASAVAIWSLMRPAAAAVAPACGQEMERAVAIVDAQDMSDANLVRMGDKSIMFSADGRAFIMYGRWARSWIALFDPVGPVDAWPDLIWQFIEAARSNGCRAVFYQVSARGLSHYADAGLRAFRLGELAEVDLQRLEMKGGNGQTCASR